MKKNAMPTLLGVLVSLLTIWALHKVLFVDECLDNHGAYQYKTGQCLLEYGEVYHSNIENIALLLYFFIGYIVSLLVAKITRKLMNYTP